MNFFEEAALRLKQQLGVSQDKEVASHLGLSPRAWAGRKQSNSFPEKELRALAQQRPDLGLDVEYVLTGELLTQREREHLASARALTQQLPVEDAEKQRLLALLDDGFLRQATQNAARLQPYMQLMEMLNSCSDESLRLVLLTAEKFRIADLVVKREDKAT